MLLFTIALMQRGCTKVRTYKLFKVLSYVIDSGKYNLDSKLNQNKLKSLNRYNLTVSRQNHAKPTLVTPFGQVF